MLKQLEKAFSLILKHPVIVLTFSVILTLLSIYFSQKLRIRTNFSDLLPDNHPAVVQAKELEKIVGGASFLVVTVRSEEPQAADRFLNDLREKLEGAEGIRTIDDRPPTDFFQKNGLLYLSLSDLDQLRQNIKKRIERGKLKKARLFIDLEEGKGIDQELGELQKKYAAYLQGTSRYQSRDGKLFVSLIKPEWRTTDVARTKILLNQLDRIFSDLNPESYHPSLHVRLTGPYVKTVTQQKILLKDAVLVSLIAFLGAILYLFFHFRSLRPVFLIGLPLSVGTSWILAAAWLLFGSLNLFSSVACAVLLGLGVDYGIHIYSEYSRERDAGQSAADALWEAMKRLGRAFIVASTTTAAAFFALTLSKFKALHEFGMVAGFGLLLCVLSFLTLFPALILLLERWRPGIYRGSRYADFLPRTPSAAESDGQSPIRFLWLFRPKTAWVMGLILLLPFLSVGLGRLRFDYNLNHVLGTQETKGLDAEVDRIFNHTVNPEVALVQNPDDAGKLAEAIRQVQKSEPADRSTISQVLSLQDLIPSEQSLKREKIAGIRSLFTPTVIRGFSEEERQAHEKFKPLLEPETVSLKDLPEQILTKFRDREGVLGRMIFVFPNFDMQDSYRFMQFAEALKGVQCPECSGPFYTSGESTVFYEIVKLLFREGKYVIGFSLAAILLSLLLNYRSLTATLTAFTPLLLGFLSTLGWMGLLGIPFNIINLAALPIILGTADDYSIHLFQRFRDQKELSLSRIYQQSFRPILGSAITTFIGFGSLWFADMGGVRSFGTVCAMGILLCALTNLTFFPALLAWFRRRQEKRAVSFVAQWDESVNI